MLFDSGAGDDDDAMIVICPNAVISRASWFEMPAPSGHFVLNVRLDAARPRAKYLRAVDVRTNAKIRWNIASMTVRAIRFICRFYVRLYGFYSRLSIMRLLW